LNVPISSLDENPHRNLGTYPTIPEKVAALARSIKDVGLWEGIIARPAADRFQLAFGHHRLEAARVAGLSEVPVIVRDLTDEQMLQFMGRENGEDYGTQFLIMLNTWEGAAQFLADDRRQKTQALDIAKLLGWISGKPGDRAGESQLSHLAMACASAHALITGGYLAREDLAGLSVSAAREIVSRAHSRMDQIERSAAVTNTPRKTVERAKEHVAKAAQITATAVREGRVAQRDIRSEVDVNAYKVAVDSKVKDSPLFAVFSKALADSLEKILKTDSASERLEQIAAAVNKVTMDVDRAVIRQVDYQLGEVSIRAEAWRKRLIPNNEKIVGLPRLENKNV
jgi:hypothetical protein